MDRELPTDSVLVLAIGPRAIDALMRASSTIDARLSSGPFDVSMRDTFGWLVIAIDGRDEGFLRSVGDAARSWIATRGSSVTIVYRSPHDDPARRQSQLRRFAKVWGACVLAAPGTEGAEIEDVVASFSASLVRPGLMGFDPSDLMSLTAGAVGEPLITSEVSPQAIDRFSAQIRDADKILIVLHCPPTIELSEINAIWERIEVHTRDDVSIMMACPSHPIARMTIVPLTDYAVDETAR